MDMRIPLQTTAKGMKNTDEARGKVLSFIEFAEHIKDDIADGVEKTVEQRTVFAKENAKFFRNGKNTMSMDGLDDFERHGSGALDRIEVSTGRTKTTFAVKRDKFESTTRRTPVHSAAESGVSTVNHLFDVFENHRASIEGVLDFFVMI